jgi:hypothetical protein
MTRNYQAPAKGSNPALDLWAGSALRDVMLPSGTWVRIRLTPVEQLVKRNLIPDDLTGVAMRVATEGVNTKGLSAEEMREFLRYVDEVVCQMVREVKVGEEWTPVTLTPAIMEEFDFPGDDLEQLGLIAIRRSSPEIVTMNSKLAHGMITAAQVAEARKEAEAGTTGDLLPFRQEPEVPRPSPDGEGVLDETVGASGDIRPGSRARLRSSRIRSTT